MNATTAHIATSSLRDDPLIISKGEPPCPPHQRRRRADPPSRPPRWRRPLRRRYCRVAAPSGMCLRLARQAHARTHACIKGARTYTLSNKTLTIRPLYLFPASLLSLRLNMRSQQSIQSGFPLAHIGQSTSETATAMQIYPPEMRLGLSSPRRRGLFRFLAEEPAPWRRRRDQVSTDTYRTKIGGYLRSLA